MSRSEPSDIRALPISVGLPVWIRVALLSFGGPAGQIAVMHRLLVEERKWVSEERFLHCMSYCMLLPGPEAQQLATYLGWLLHGRRGGLVAGILFVLPGFLSILVLSALYVAFADTSVLGGLLFGVKCAVIAIVLEALLRIGKRALVGRFAVLLAVGAFIAIFLLGVPFPLIVLAAAVLGYLRSRATAATGGDPAVPDAPSSLRPSLASTVKTVVFWLGVWLVPVLVLALSFGRDSVFVEESLFFSKAAVVTFGGAYAVLAYIAQQAVEVYGWLVPGEMLDALGMAETTPGPLIQVVQFVGYLAAYRNPGELSPAAAGVLGSVVTTWVTFVPCFLFVFAGAPFAEHLRGRKGPRGALSAITAAIVGVILNLAVWFSLHTLFSEVGQLGVGSLSLPWPDPRSLDWAALALTIGACLAMLRYRAGMLPTLGVTAALGLLYRLASL